ncbi:MAG TPA: class III extradiol ring-cleavage dioxygenase [Planctomycetota bacterium]|nr:class III extradiol ring-cleavage dioxygenase [Planctomycetota bacterium]
MPDAHPPVFISHGAPSLATDGGASATFLARLGADIGRPRAVLCASAHWVDTTPLVGADPRPATIHDFSGFGEDLDRMRYPAPGDPALAARVVDLLRVAGFAGAAPASRGLDHGAWVPLSLMFPAADLPVVQIALQPRLGPAHHLAVGRALRPLVDEGVLVLGSGGASHNLREAFAHGGAGEEAPAWVVAFERWMAQALADGREDDLIHYAERAPHAARNHPTDEHLLPLFVALGAAGPGARGTLLHEAVTFGVLSMACFAFAMPSSPPASR